MQGDAGNGTDHDQDADDIELSWGNAAAVVAITEKIAKREGFGAVLADGVGKAAERMPVCWGLVLSIDFDTAIFSLIS